ncbi:cell division protein FtsW [Novosphingobium marinum]|uniref:Probable peptidoglycan glycosyltransferase FtsW n=1 Tax=Novosphingobium marinum TaxID=1514948 RepID=A0A7Y9XVB2_9SPHN|nr:putative peptidoglycan glycosyltransferase FtsW [Novosphingobium marinum]NYH95249.1 cell division protein FtsW [Novosphingobium marinum]GGC25511.1 cell division protein FtsW [Novosphingobium marinum]
MASNPSHTPLGGGSLQRYNRNRRSEFAIWWREIDRTLLFLVLCLMAIGTAAVAAASPASARRLSTAAVRLDDLHFFLPHIRWQLIGLAVMIGASFLGKDMARRVGICLAAVMIGLLLLVPVAGFEVNGAKRWINLGASLQPSSFLKPGFAITVAWILSWRVRDPKLPTMELSLILTGLVGVLLMLQPDFGSTLLYVGVWFVLVLLSGMPVRTLAVTIGAGVVGLVCTYLFYDNGRNRIDAFLGGGSAFDQVDLAQRTLLAGGWTGSGLWLGTRKMSLPEAHTDYIFSVIGEEFGLLVCALIVVLYLAILVRVLMRLVDEEDLFTVLAASGLVTLFGGQAFINMLVNLQLFPSKGMTLPLISYGGSSTIALCLTIGLLLAVTRRNPFIERERFSLRDIGGKA